MTSFTQIRNAIPKGTKATSTSRALLLFAASWLAYGTCFYFAATDHFSFWSRLPASLLEGVFIGSLFVIGHDACHLAFVGSSFLSRVLGRLAFLPQYQPFTSWVYSHNMLHHSFTNVRGLDPTYPPFTFEEFSNLPPWRRLLERLYRSRLGIGLYGFVEIYWKQEIFPPRSMINRFNTPNQFQIDRILVGLFTGLQLCLIVVLSRNRFEGVCWAVLLPYAIWIYLFSMVTVLHHTNPRVPWFQGKDQWNAKAGLVNCSVHLEFPRVLELIFMEVLDHTAHHVDPRIPLYHLREAQEALQELFPGEIIVQHLTWRTFGGIISKCKLYNYSNHQWLDFDGVPTSDPIPLS
ncbi:MAG: fatty acid desaturase [Fimbriimonas sp.]|nr:fatty acid desaturase [Fimbriimonas sp.]